MTEIDPQALRARLIATCRAMNAQGINQGTSGNASARDRHPDHGDGLWVTPTGMPYDALAPEDLPFIAFADAQSHGRRAPSSEWRFHYDILRARPDQEAVIHAHSSFATALSCHGRDLPAFHYMVAVGGGEDIRCAPYALFGTQALSDHALTALEARKACLLAHHGVICLGASPEKALGLLIEVETLCGTYLRALQIGEPPLLSAAQMEAVIAKFQTYGRQPDQKDE